MLKVLGQRGQASLRLIFAIVTIVMGVLVVIGVGRSDIETGVGLVSAGASLVV